MGGRRERSRKSTIRTRRSGACVSGRVCGVPRCTAATDWVDSTVSQDRQAARRRTHMSSTIESVLQEKRVFPPPAEFVTQANISGMDAYRALCAEAERDFEGFWARLRARDLALARSRSRKTLDESKAPFFRWFHDGELNASYNCLDRHLDDAARQDRDHLRGRRRQGDEDHLQGALPRGLQVRERAEGARHQDRRPRARLHADVDPGGGRDAGVRAHRRHALGGVRRLLGEEHPGARSSTPARSPSSPPTGSSAAAARSR